MDTSKLSPKDYALMTLILCGADIWSPVLASALRDLQQRCPACISIGPARAADDIPGNERQPYFGAIVTADGKRALNSYRRRHSKLTRSHWDAMARIEAGCDCWRLEIYSLIRYVERLFPEYILWRGVSHPAQKSDGQVFPAILTEAGCQALAFHQKRNRP